MFYNSTTRTYCGVRAPLFKIVVDIRSGGFVGYTALLWDDRNSEANRDAVLVMAVAGAWWGKGLGTEICRWTLARAFDSLALHRVSVGVFENNLRALAVCWNSGFVQEGVRRKASMVSPGRWEDVVLMGILKEDYLEEQGRAQAAESAQALEARAQDRALEREMAYALALDSEEEQGADPDVEDPDAENGVLRDTQTREDGRSPSYEHIVSEDLYDEESEESWIMASQGEERENVEEA
ncbi:acyl-CoA N-acyltransferase [Artomyces pyxidatus]|uniref:Acyl-CoA N-acyltransferase n=1 Tax=Artomyces pyxidatus TaxID=48021 RepID=A0ACB8T4B8_9AGAM|nr:acyl-CoA N-acyltransferase [Artomyces pyxidatus]